MTKKISACIYCKITPQEVQHNCVLGAGIRYRVMCVRCKRNDGWFINRKEAVKEWNKQDD